MFCEPKKNTGDNQGRVEVNHASLGAGQVKNRILCLLEKNFKNFYRLVEGKCFQVSDSPTKDKVGWGRAHSILRRCVHLLNVPWKLFENITKMKKIRNIKGAAVTVVAMLWENSLSSQRDVWDWCRHCGPGRKCETRTGLQSSSSSSSSLGKAGLRPARPSGIVGPRYRSSGYLLRCSQRLTSRLQRSARI